MFLFLFESGKQGVKILLLFFLLSLGVPLGKVPDDQFILVSGPLLSLFCWVTTVGPRFYGHPNKSSYIGCYDCI